MAWTTPITFTSGQLVTAAIANEQISGNAALLKTSVNDSGALEFVDATELTIASGVITVTQNYHKVDTQGDAASDDLDTITAGTNVAAGFILFLRVESGARTVVLKNGTSGADNLDIGADITLDETYKTYCLVYDGTNWRPVTYAAATTFASISPLTTRGDLLYGSSGTVTGARLAVGAANQVLTSDGTDVAWAAAAGGGFPFIEKLTLGSGFFDTGTISLAASGCLLVWQNIENDTDNEAMQIYVGDSGGVKTSGYTNMGKLWRRDGETGYGNNASSSGQLDTEIATYGRLGNAAGEQSSGHVYVSSDGTYCTFYGVNAFMNTINKASQNVFFGMVACAAITQIQIKPSGGNFDSGEVMLYDIAEA